MVGSIDPRCETVRGTHWPNEGRVVVWSSRRGNHLGQRSKAPHQQAGHMDASDPIRPSKNSCGTGAVHIWVPAFAGTTRESSIFKQRKHSFAISRRDSPEVCQEFL